MLYWLSLPGLGRGLKLVLFVGLGIAGGLGLYVARISNAASYLSTDPATCLNCHVMTDAFATWQRGSHARFTKCVDCHVPHQNPVAGLAFKAQDGMRHASVFSLRTEPQVLRLNPAAVPVVQENCLRCHANQFFMVRLSDSNERPCWRCHQNIHGRVQSLSASPSTYKPDLPRAGF